MEKAVLAEHLRKKQRKLGMVDLATINRLSDEEIIDCYITCSCCGEKEIDDPVTLANAIDLAKDTDDFFRISSSLSTIHQEGRKKD